jgi:hypothetical protein
MNHLPITIYIGISKQFYQQKIQNQKPKNTYTIDFLNKLLSETVYN